MKALVGQGFFELDPARIKLVQRGLSIGGAFSKMFPSTLTLAFICLTGFALSYILFARGQFLARKLKFVDKAVQDKDRKDHVGAVPPIGGLIIIPVFMLCIILERLLGEVWLVSWPVVAALGAILVMGAVDDKYDLSARFRFIFQFAVATFIVLCAQAKLGFLGSLFGPGETYTGFLAVPFTVLCLVVLMNALNMLDGLDGLSGGWCMIVLLIFAGAAALEERWPFVWASLFMIGPLCAFLIFNMRHPWRRKASIFMGDAGALALALFIGWLVIRMSQGVENDKYAYVLPPAVLIWVLAVPIMDLFALFFTRLAQKRHPFSPDRYHLHYRLIARGLSTGQATWSMLGITLFLAVIGLGLYVLGTPDYILMYLWIAVLLAHTARTYMKYGRSAMSSSSGP